MTNSTPQLARPEVGAVHELLQHYEAVVAHFSSCPRLAQANSFTGNFPSDLLNVLNDRAQGGISCSVVSQNDRFEPFGVRNATGNVGLVVRLRSPQSLVAVSPMDCGSIERGGVRWAPQADQPIAIWEVKDSIDSRPTDRYNEWVVKDYEIAGLILQPPLSVHDLLTEATIEEISTCFGHLNWYTLQPGGLHRVHHEAIGERVSIATLYPVADSASKR